MQEIDREYILSRFEELRMRESFEIREVAMKLIALVGMYRKDTVMPAICFIENQGQEGKVIAKAMREVFELNE